MAPVPDLLVAGNGQHLAVVRADGVPLRLRSRSGDFVRALVSEAAAFDGDPIALAGQPFARCTRDAFIADVVRDGQAWRLLAIRSRDTIDWTALTRACADADIIVASGRMPRGCNPRWLKLDRQGLSQSGGMALYVGETPHIETVNDWLGGHPWRQAVPPLAMLAKSRLMVAPHREFVSAGVDEVKPATAGE